MKTYQNVLTGSVAFLALGLALSGNGAKVKALITGTNALCKFQGSGAGIVQKRSQWPICRSRIRRRVAGRPSPGRLLRPRVQCRPYRRASKWKPLPRA